DMLNLQVDEFRKVMDANKLNKGQKIVFIHGKGDGVLRQALMKELNYRYKGMVEVQDASFREYGFGATQVTVR
ncbi:MAG: Smr/MutS family protein, partial [Paramuribaculum sp.]|nr:Smr/MutS family protein [Paramuribaculum sp.]